MKKVKCIVIFLVVTALSSCLDTEEKIVLNADNSGTYCMSINLNRMLKMMAEMGNGKSDSGAVAKKTDTTIYFKEIVNTADELTTAEKILYKDAFIHAKIDEERNEMMVVMNTPFKNATDLMEIRNNFSSVINKLKVLNKAMGEDSNSVREKDDLDMRSKANPVGEFFTFKAGKGKISNTVTNLAAFKKTIATDSSLSIMTRMSSMVGDFNYRTIIVLPKAVKNFAGPGSHISADKKTITFFTTLSEMLVHPEKVSYKVEY